MKKLLVLAFSLAVVSTSIPAAFGADTADTAPAAAKPAKKKTHQTEDQRKLHKEMLDKYDTNKDGKLDKEERSKITKEDREKLKQSRSQDKHQTAPGGDKKESSQ